MKFYLIILLLVLITTVGYSEETNKITKIVSDVVILSEAKVSTEVIETYVKNFNFIPIISPFDIVYMSNRGVTNTVIKLLINKNGETKKIIADYVAKREYRESYDFFYEMYLLPRAKYNSYQKYKRF